MNILLPCFRPLDPVFCGEPGLAPPSQGAGVQHLAQACKCEDGRYGCYFDQLEWVTPPIMSSMNSCIDGIP